MLQQDKIERIYSKLLEEFGKPEKRRLDPVEELVLTILSQNTSDRNRDLAWERLRSRFRTMEELAEAPVEEIEELIKPSGLHRQKARRIKEVLARIRKDFSSLEIKLPADRLYDYLLSLPGIGPKTAAVVLAFSFDLPYFPVDTHVFRVARRLGLSSARTREKVQQEMERIVPPHLKKDLHLLLINLGRSYCRPSKPLCSRCPLRELCPTSGLVVK